MSKGAQEEAMAATYTNSSGGGAGGKEDYPQVIVKGKRTKRMRLLQVLAPAAAAPAPTSSASSSGDLSGSTATTTAATTEEEKDMANCLILLAQGRTEPRLEEEAGRGEGAEKLPERRFPEAATTTTDGKVAGAYAYECKTCNKCFPSFQALGGHRASHKKPKTLHPPAAAAADEKRAIMQEDGLQISLASCPKTNTNILPRNGGGRPTPPTTTTTTIPTPTTTTNNNNYSSIAASNSKPRVHECSICGSEFSSGQALGGHMRRHRAPAPAPERHQEAKKERSLLSLDLNLPAPVDDDRGDFPRSPSFAFSGKRPLIFSASALVDCHY